MPTLNDATGLQVGAQTGVKSMLGSALVWSSAPAGGGPYYPKNAVTVTPNETAYVYQFYKMAAPRGPYLSPIT